MNPYEWPWENHPVEEDRSHRVTIRLRKKVRKLSRKVSRMDRELRKMRKYLQRLAAASARSTTPAPPAVSDATLKLVGEAQRAAASYSTTRSARAAQEVTRTREALLRHVAELESGASVASRAPSPPLHAPRAPQPAPPPAPFVAAEPPAPSGRAPAPPEGAAAAPDSVYRWMRDAVSLLRAAGFSSEGHGILRDQLTEQALSFMAQRAAQADAPRTQPPPHAPRGGADDRAPIGRPRLGGAPLAPPVPPSMAARAPFRPMEPFQAPPPPAQPQAEPEEQDFPQAGPVQTDAPLAEHPPYHSSAEPPLTDPGEGGWPEAHRNGDMDAAVYDQAPEGTAEEDASGPRRWWSYAPIPPRPEE